MGRHKRPRVNQDQREEWKQEYRSLSDEIHTASRNDVPVDPEKKNRLRALGRYLRSQSGD